LGHIPFQNAGVTQKRDKRKERDIAGLKGGNFRAPQRGNQERIFAKRDQNAGDQWSPNNEGSHKR